MNRKLTILCVDDDPFSLRALQRALMAEYAVLMARDGRQAMDVVEGHDIDIVITDFQMPKMTGISLLRYLQREHPHIRRILITGNPESVEEAAHFERVQIHACLKKPWRIADLLKQVHEVQVVCDQPLRAAL